MFFGISKKSIIPAVTIGSILEWYEIGIYIYWADIIEKEFFNFTLPVVEFLDTIIAIAVGMIARPLGGLIFGRIGDRKGRRKPFIETVVLISVPTILIGITGTYSQWSLFSVIFVGIMKFLQGLPAGGEIPGAICFLAEAAPHGKEKYNCSFAFVGPQIGLLFSLTMCLILQKYLPNNLLVSWGWRLSFFFGGIIGFLGYFLRKKLHESNKYQQLRQVHKTVENPVRILFATKKKKVFLCFCVSIFEVVFFSIVTIVPVFYFKQVFKITDNQNLIINVLTLSSCCILPPIIGRMSDIYKKIPFLEISAIGAIFLSYYLYEAISKANLSLMLISLIIAVILLSFQVALIPYVVSSLFPTSIRYTGIGFSFNVSDGIFWVLTPILSIALMQYTQQFASFIIFIPISAIIFLISYHFVKKEKLTI